MQVIYSKNVGAGLFVVCSRIIDDLGDAVRYESVVNFPTLLRVGSLSCTPSLRWAAPPTGGLVGKGMSNEPLHVEVCLRRASCEGHRTSTLVVCVREKSGRCLEKDDNWEVFDHLYPSGLKYKNFCMSNIKIKRCLNSSPHWHRSIRKIKDRFNVDINI